MELTVNSMITDLLNELDITLSHREVPPKYTSIRGIFNSLKSTQKGRPIQYESLIEKNFLLMLDHDPNCVFFDSQCIKISRKGKGKKIVHYYPDILAFFDDDHRYLLDVKNIESLIKLEVSSKNWLIRKKTLIKYCKAHELTYKLITEMDLDLIRLSNIRSCLISAKHFNLYDFADDDTNLIFQLIKNNSLTFRRLLDEIAPINEENTDAGQRKSIVSLLKYLLYYNRINIDWHEPILDSILGYSGLIPPLYHDFSKTDPILDKIRINSDPINKTDNPNIQLTDNEIKRIEPLIRKFGNKADQKDIRNFSKEYALKYEFVNEYYRKWKIHFKQMNNRLLFEPVVQAFGYNGKRGEILAYLTSNLKYSSEEAIKLYKKYKGYDFENKGYKKKDNANISTKQQRATKWDDQIEFFINSTLIKWNKDHNLSLRVAYEEIFLNLVKEYYGEDYSEKEIPSYDALHYRSQKIRPVEHSGKKNPKYSQWINRPTEDSFTHDIHAGSYIQLDHTILDIWLVDPHFRLPYAMPWLSVGIDTYTGAIWALYLSYDPPNQETVNLLILNGLTNKRQSLDWLNFASYAGIKDHNISELEWNSSGFPDTIQVDNGRDFQANSVKRFVTGLNMTYEFRPAYQPQTAGFIESLWDTINDEIRRQQLPGHSYPKDRKRIIRKTKPKWIEPDNYNARENARLTLDEFSSWLTSFILEKYNYKSHGYRVNNPNIFWEESQIGIKGHHPAGLLKTIEKSNEWIEIDTGTFQKNFESDYEFSEYNQLKIKSLPENDVVIRSGRIRYKNILYNELWFKIARRERRINDGRKITIKYSLLDRRWLWVEDKNTGFFRRLTAFNHVKDKRITRLLKRSLPKIADKYLGFTVSQKLIDYLLKEFEESNSPLLLKSTYMDLVENDIKGKISHKQQKIVTKSRNLPAASLLEILKEDGDEDDIDTTEDSIEVKETAEERRKRYVKEASELENWEIS